MMPLNKRGVSPLAATMLLIVFAVVLGVVVMNVGGSYLALEEEGVEKFSSFDLIDKCADVGAITAEEQSFLISSLE